MKHALILTALLALAACGGGGDAPAAPAEPTPVVTKPLTDSAPPPAEQPVDERTEQPAEEPVDTTPPIELPPAGDKCRAPRASEQGIAHGKPPVGRCE